MLEALTSPHEFLFSSLIPSMSINSYTDESIEVFRPSIILNLSKNIDIASEQFSKTGDEGYAWQYMRLKEELCELKEFIKQKERKSQDVPDTFLNSN